MLTILKMNPIGNKGEQPVVYFEFGFDNTIELPKLAFQIGEDISIVANNSIAVNNKTDVVYKFNGDSWIRTNDKYNSSNNSNITTNGNYSIANNSIGGFNSVNVDVEPTGLIEKEITENGEYLPAEDEATAYSKVTVNVPVNFEYITFPTMNSSGPYYSVLCKNNNGIYVLPSGNIFDEEHSTRTHYDAYILTPAVSIDPVAIESGHVIFTPGENFVFEHNGNPMRSITGDTITPLDGKVYYLSISNNMGMLTRVVTKTNNNFHHEIKS